MSRPPIWDASDHSILVGCDKCAWREIHSDALAATRSWADHYRAEHARGPALGLRRRVKPRATCCRDCGTPATETPVEPFAGLCGPCRKKKRAEYARAKYAAQRRSCNAVGPRHNTRPKGRTR